MPRPVQRRRMHIYRRMAPYQKIYNKSYYRFENKPVAHYSDNITASVCRNLTTGLQLPYFQFLIVYKTCWLNFHLQMKEESRAVFQTVWKWWDLTITGRKQIIMLSLKHIRLRIDAHYIVLLLFLKLEGLQPLFFLKNLLKWLSSVNPSSSAISFILIWLCNNLLSTNFSL